MKLFFWGLTLLLFLPCPLSAQTCEISGELSAWLTYRDNVSDNYLLGMRYMPEATVSHSVSDNNTLDLTASANANFEVSTDSLVIDDDVSDIEFYRLWMRWSKKQFEVRGGLQKINFGPARILRSLMWFDRVDPRDPFSITDGVKGLLVRYYFLDNSNLWLWGLYGNDDIKGLETTETDKDSPELGGRYQFPLTRGEMAFSFHHRKTERRMWPDYTGTKIIGAQEERIALDAFRDIGVGLWFEAVAGRIRIDNQSSLWSEMLTVGGDYTFAGGIHLLAEHFLMAEGPHWDETDSIKSVTAVSLDYAINIMDRINMIAAYDWTDNKGQNFVGWQRTYDDWRIDILGFTAPEEIAGEFRGDGLRLIVTYSH